MEKGKQIEDMRKRITVLNTGVNKEEVIVEGICCSGSYVTFIWM